MRTLSTGHILATVQKKGLEAQIKGLRKMKGGEIEVILHCRVEDRRTVKNAVLVALGRETKSEILFI
jgi:hypothetical protein